VFRLYRVDLWAFSRRESVGSQTSTLSATKQILITAGFLSEKKMRAIRLCRNLVHHISHPTERHSTAVPHSCFDFRETQRRHQVVGTVAGGAQVCWLRLGKNLDKSGRDGRLAQEHVQPRGSLTLRAGSCDQTSVFAAAPEAIREHTSAKNFQGLQILDFAQQ
jgi:hypothetical protein